MSIRLAQTALEELDALRAQTLAAAIAAGASLWESEPWDICGLRVQIRCRLRLSGRGRKLAWHTYLILEGKRRGYNHVRGALRRLEKKE